MLGRALFTTVLRDVVYQRYNHIVGVDVNQWIPHEFLARIREGHATGRTALAQNGVLEEYVESVAVSEMVEAHRWAWRPEKPRLILIAESHAFTTLAELAAVYKPVLGAEHAPSNYVRFIYSLGYGEASLCPSLTGGTPQYWSLFGKIVGTNPKHIPGAVPGSRLREKIATLHKMRDRGIWLLDASLHGIYVPGGGRIDSKRAALTPQIQRLWWRYYGRHLLEDAAPECVVAIGKGLLASMQGIIPFTDWIYQPNARITLELRARDHRTLDNLADWTRGPQSGLPTPVQDLQSGGARISAVQDESVADLVMRLVKAKQH